MDQLDVGRAERTVLDADGYALAALHAGLPDAPAVLLVPGYTGTKEDFAPILDPIAHAGLHAVRSLVLLSSGPADLGGTRRTLIELLEPVLAQGGLPGVYAAMQSVGAEGSGRSPELAAFLQHRFLAGSPAMLAGMGRALRTEPDRVTELAATGVPVLVTHGENDDAWPPAVQLDMAARLRARHAAIPDAAHSAAIENPAALLPVLLDFWRTTG
jgi:pimeloyl-ACP methyl ester carboxylesterase